MMLLMNCQIKNLGQTLKNQCNIVSSAMQELANTPQDPMKKSLLIAAIGAWLGVLQTVQQVEL